MIGGGSLQGKLAMGLLRPRAGKRLASFEVKQLGCMYIMEQAMDGEVGMGVSDWSPLLECFLPTGEVWLDTRCFHC